MDDLDEKTEAEVATDDTADQETAAVEEGATPEEVTATEESDEARPGVPAHAEKGDEIPDRNVV